MRAASGRAVAAPRPIASNVSRIDMHVLIGPKVAEKGKNRLNPERRGCCNGWRGKSASTLLHNVCCTGEASALT